MDEPTVDLSSTFWNLYDEVKAFQPKYKLGRSEISLEQRAEKNLKISLKLLKGTYSDYSSFIQVLIKDIRNYHTLSERSLRRIGSLDLTDDKKSVDNFLSEIKWLKKQLGEDYIELIEQTAKGKSKEVIIAIENNDLSELL
ncbi:hypothetical protein D3C86_1826290 [compost metagenome]